VDRVEKVTRDDIRRVANKTFVADNRTVAVLESTQPAKPGTKGAN
jgi:predicted Zn-dependent peptidase